MSSRRGAVTVASVVALMALRADAGFQAGSPEAAELEASVASAVDRSVDPCADFYQFACGGWIAANPLPADKPIYGRGFSTIQDRNLGLLREMLESGAGGDARLGAFYGACVDEAAAEAAGVKPLEADLARIAGAPSTEALLVTLAGMPLSGGFFDSFVEPDFKNPDVYMFHLFQGGLGLPTRDDYFPKDAAGKQLLADYTAHVGRTLALAGLDAAAAPRIVAFETQLARVSKPPAALREVDKLYHPMSRDEVAALAPNVPWARILDALGVKADVVNAATPEFLAGLSKVLKKAKLDDLKAYASWHLVSGSAALLTKALDDERFGFYGQRLAGQKQQQPRWKRCVQRTDEALGDLLGKAYVDRAFAGDSKATALSMVAGLESAFAAGLPELAWMDDATRERARAKLATIVKKIGYPDTWETYPTLEVGPDAYANAVAVARWQTADKLGKVGQAVDKDEWGMTASTVNAYYNPLANEIAFPAGILQPPFFSASFPAAMNYGAMGMVIGHEITHGFDDEGRKFGPTGKLETWWDESASEAFEAEAQCIVDTYGKIEVQPGVFLNGDLTLGENIADFGGIKLASAGYAALRASGHGEPGLAGFTPEQLLFVGYAQSWCSVASPEVERLRAKTDPHSPPRERVNVPLAHLPAFWEAFSCAEGAPMHPKETCGVW